MLRELLRAREESLLAIRSLLQIGSPLYPATLGDGGRDGKLPEDPFASEFEARLQYASIGNVHKPCRLSWHLIRTLVPNGETLPVDLTTIILDSKKPCMASAYEWLLTQWAELFHVEYSYCHFPSTYELPDLYECGVLFSHSLKQREMTVMIPSYLLNFFLPNLFWSQTFGTTYVSLFGRDRLLSCPGYRVIEWPNGSITIQLTPNISDTHDRFPEFRDARAKAKAHLGDEILFSEQKGRFGEYLVPDFGLCPPPPHLQQLRPLLNLQGVLDGNYSVWY
jgi:hypothetical protein